MDTFRAADLPWPDLQTRLQEGWPLVLPIGSFEQHGPHLPVSTDALIAEALSTAVAEELGALALPTLPFGAPSRPRSGGSDLFAAPDLPLPTLMAVVEAVARGGVSAGCRWLIVLSWHMENAAVLWDALRPAVASGTCTIQLFDAPWDFLTPELEAELFPEGDPSWAEDHAGRLETAMMLHLAPSLVRECPEPVPFVPRRGFDVLPTPHDAVPSTGVVLDARDVTAATGERSTAAIVDGIVSAVRAERARH
jgi:creatinine amidohydrolase